MDANRYGVAIHFDCPKCGKHYSLKCELAGRRAKCACGHTMVVPHSHADEHHAPPPPKSGIPATSATASKAPEVVRQARTLAKQARSHLKDAPAPADEVIRGSGPLVSRLFMFDLVVLGGAVLLLLCGPTVWASFGPFGAVGFRSDGIIPFAAGVAILVLWAMQLRASCVPKWNVVTIRITALVAMGVGIYAFLNLVTLGTDVDNPFAQALVSTVQPGLGIYLAMSGGLVVLMGTFATLLAKRFAWAGKLLNPVSEPTTEQRLSTSEQGVQRHSTPVPPPSRSSNEVSELPAGTSGERAAQMGQQSARTQAAPAMPGLCGTSQEGLAAPGNLPSRPRSRGKHIAVALLGLGGLALLFIAIVGRMSPSSGEGRSSRAIEEGPNAMVIKELVRELRHDDFQDFAEKDLATYKNEAVPYLKDFILDSTNDWIPRMHAANALWRIKTNLSLETLEECAALLSKRSERGDKNVHTWCRDQASTLRSQLSR